MRLVVCAVALLAGCGAPESVDDVFLGAIHGTVLDEALQPLAGALVSLQGMGNATTDATGSFAFLDLTPGPYTVHVARPGYEQMQVGAVVEAGVEGSALRVVLERELTIQPRLVADLFQGVITCSLRIPTAGFNDGCGVFGGYGLGSTQRNDMGAPAGRIWWIQTEVSWVSLSPLAERLCVDQGELLHEEVVCETSSIVQGMDRTTVERRSLHRGDTFRVVVYPDHLLADASGNIVIDQDFEIFLHALYDFLPPEGWEFGRDGLPPVPG